MLTVLECSSASRLSASDAPRDSRSPASTSANSSASSSATVVSRPLASQSEKPGPGEGMPGLQHHLVDDQLADIEQQQRLHGAQHAQADGGRGQRPAGAPDLLEQPLQVPERRQPLAERHVLVATAASQGQPCGEIFTGAHLRL